jgi:DNA-binding PadR family transcriptional regulator
MNPVKMDPANRHVLLLRDIRALQPFAYGTTITTRMYERLGPSKWLRIGPEWRVNMSALYDRLESLEKAGLIRSNWSEETFADRGNRRRKYYYLTERGTTVLDTIPDDTRPPERYILERTDKGWWRVAGPGKATVCPWYLVPITWVWVRL